jgi:uncharacterized protein (DUF2235 family)
MPGSRLGPGIGGRDQTKIPAKEGCMSKNVVVCLDGTGNQLKAKGNTNVVHLYQMLDISDRASQVAYYDPGVGTFSATGAWTPVGRKASRLAGLALGSGLRTNLAQAYTYLMQHWEPGDKLYVFGFSRGAYTARALAGLLHRAGLLRPGSDNLVPYAVGVYARSKQAWTRDDWRQIDKFADSFSWDADGSRSVPIEFMGLWDSVKAAGVLRWNPQWPYTRQLPNVNVVRHAVSIDEKRRPYREYLVEAKPPRPALEEVWFAGVHSDVGGTFEDDPRLAHITRKWMVDGAVAAGLKIAPGAYQKICPVTADDASGTIHRMGLVWAALTYRHRRIPPGARVHCSVQPRLTADPSYEHKMPRDVVWDDENWLTPKI